MGNIDFSNLVAGVDEAGRGPLAGPVVCAAVVLPPHHGIVGLADSKKLSEKKRALLFEAIMKNALSIGVAATPAHEVDEVNIRQATLRAMTRSVLALNLVPKLVLIDGRDVPMGLPCDGRAIIGGDDLHDEISAASIIAKVTRDRLMLRLDRAYPAYGFAKHKGYGTAEHLKALAKFGPSPAHRISFAPVAKSL
jgi:ribonuclease HII